MDSHSPEMGRLWVGQIQSQKKVQVLAMLNLKYLLDVQLAIRGYTNMNFRSYTFGSRQHRDNT